MKSFFLSPSIKAAFFSGSRAYSRKSTLNQLEFYQEYHSNMPLWINAAGLTLWSRRVDSESQLRGRQSLESLRTCIREAEIAAKKGDLADEIKALKYAKIYAKQSSHEVKILNSEYIDKIETRIEQLELVDCKRSSNSLK